MKNIFRFQQSLILLLVFILSLGCGDQSTSNQDVEGDNPSYELAEDKTELAKYYEIDFIKEWYSERVLPPKFDYDMDISNKSYMELRLLRNEIFARNGYLFDEASLRGYFNQFKWYQPIFDVPEFKVQLDKQEQAFVEKVLALEQGKEKERYVEVGQNKLVNTDHIANLVQYENIGDKLIQGLKARNFAINPASHDQLFYVYDENQYQYIPNFYTTDAYLQLLHKHFGAVLQDIEEEKMVELMDGLLFSLYNESKKSIPLATDEKSKAALVWANTYLAIGLSALRNTNDIGVDATMLALYKDEMTKVRSASGDGSVFLDRVIFDYTQFKPRGNYTRNDTLKQYFKCIKWLNSAPFNIGSEQRFEAALLIAYWIRDNEQNSQSYNSFNTVIGLFAGNEDNLSISHLIKILKDNKVDKLDKLLSDKNIALCKKQLKALNVDRIQPKAGNEIAKDDFEKKNILFSAGRYTFDAEIFIRLVHVLQPEPKRTMPRGLDIFAALGNPTAESVLLDTYKEAEKWPAYKDSLKYLQKSISSAKFDEWDRSIYSKTMQVINELNKPSEDYPLFMQTQDWSKKNLNTSLAAWAELKHDVVLYAEQPYAAEAGQGGGPPPPQHLSYVEPNILFWKKALELLDYQESNLDKLQLLTEHTQMIIRDLKEMGEFFLAVSNKEIKGEKISDKEFDTMTWMGGQMEGVLFRIMKSDHLPERDKKIAVITDVYTYNRMGVKVLEVGVGLGVEIYVVAEINGMPYLTKGACFSYYEFTSGERLTDEEWQEKLEEGEPEGRPIWMKDIYIKSEPLKSKPEYSF